MGGNDTVSYTKNTENDLEINEQPEERRLHRMANPYDFLEMWQGRPNLHATWKESCAQNKKMAAGQYISDMEEIVKVFGSLFQHDGAAAFKLSERSPLPPALPAKNLPGTRTQILNVGRIW
jgi:hypothetical protein